jgi:hypothetical protein
MLQRSHADRSRLALLLLLGATPTASPLSVLVSDGWPTAAAVTQDPGRSNAAVANVLQTNDLSLLAVHFYSGEHTRYKQNLKQG